MKPKVQSLEAAWGTVIGGLGYNTKDEHLVDSPKRVARFMKAWHTVGQKPPKLTCFPNTEKYDQVVAVGGIRFYSMCAHHGLPFFGVAAIGYIPDKKVVGLSKLARVVDYFGRRFQVQERLTGEIANYLMEQLQPVGVGVVMKAEHLCMSMRGIERPMHNTITSSMLGAFRAEPETRAELLTLLHNSKGL